MVVKNEIEGEKEHLLFDIDGTLTYFNNMNRLINEAFFGLEYIIENRDRKHVQGVRNLLERSKVDRNYFNIENYIKEQRTALKIKEEDARYLVNRLLEFTPKYISGYPDISDTIEYLNIDSFCISDWFLESQKLKLKAAGIEQLFRIIYTCEGSYAKPNINRFEEIVELENLNVSKCVMIGDSNNDLAASKIGIQTVLIDYDKNKQYVYRNADAVVTEFKDLKILRR